MKTLRLIFLFLALMVITITSYSQEKDKPYIINKDKIDIKFTSVYSFDILAELKKDLKEENIDITYSSLRFDDHGHLIQISASIDFNDGVKGSFVSRILQAGDAPGFYRDRSSKELKVR